LPFPFKWVNRSLIIILLLGVFLIITIGVERHPASSSLYLNIYLFDGNAEILLYSQPVYEEQKIILSYIHSSDLTPIKQIFMVNKNESLDLHAEKYRWYGAGLEFGSGYNLSYEEGWVIITGYDRSFTTLPIRVAATVNQTLSVGSENIILSDLAPSGSTMLLKVETLQ
jgi:hypothetical protein